MRGVIIRFFTFDALNVIPEVYYALLIIGAFLIIISWFSIFSQKISLPAKLIWLAIVTLIPIAGMVVYCVYCLFIADYAYLKRFGLAGRG